MIAVERALLEPRGAREPGTTTPTERAMGSPPVTRPGRWALGCAAALVAVLPLVVDPGGWFVFIAARWVVLTVAALGLVAALLVTRSLRLPPGARWWGALVGVAAVSALASGASSVALVGANDRVGGAGTWLVHGAMVVIGASVVRRRSDLRVVVRGLSIGAIGVTLFVAAQRLGWTFPASVSRVRPGGPLGNADFLGAYATLALLAGLGAGMDDRERDGWRLVHTIATLGAAFCLVASGTRAAWFGVVVGLVVLGALAARRSGVSARRAAGVVGVALIGLIGLGLWAGVGGRLSTITSGTAAGRVATWERTATVIGERPVLGWGPEGFAAGFGRAVDDSWERTYGRRLVPDRAHNGLLDVGATLGLVGLIAYAGTLGAGARATRRALAGGATPTMVGVAAALVAYIVQQQFLFQLFDVDALAWLLLGALAGLGAAPSVRRSASLGRPAVTRSIGALVVVALGAVAISAFGGLTADRDARSSVDARTSDPSLAFATASRALVARPQTLPALLLADAALADGSTDALEAARTRLGRVQAATFDDGRLTLARARLARADGRIDLVEDSVAEVTVLLSSDPSRSDAWMELGDLQSRLDLCGDARRSYRRTVSLAPRRVDAWVALATAADRSGDEPEARAAIERVDPRSLDADQRRLRARLLGDRAVPVPGR